MLTCGLNLFLDKSHYGLPTIFYNIFFAKCIYNPHYPLLIPTAPPLISTNYDNIHVYKKLLHSSIMFAHKWIAMLRSYTDVMIISNTGTMWNSGENVSK